MSFELTFDSCAYTFSCGAFSRLVSNIRSGDPASGTLSKVWDFDMRDRDAEFKDDLREASGIGKKKGRKVRGHHICDVQMTNVCIARSSEGRRTVS